jgi:hypothetical protein
VSVRIDAKKLDQLVAKHSLRREVMASGWVKASAAEGRRFYYPDRGVVSRIDISGFEMPEGTDGIVELGERRIGNVRQQVQFEGRTEQQVLETVEWVIGFMKTLTPVLKRRRQRG